jgi:ribosomal protein S27E
MSYRDPRCVYVAESLGQADIVATMLEQNRIKAEVMDRHTQGGFEGLSAIAAKGNGVEVWVLDPTHTAEAIELIAEQEVARTTRTAARAASGKPVDVVCEDCGTATTFPAEQQGTVQDCPNCGAFVDVGEDEEDDTDAVDEDDESQPSDGIQRPPHVHGDD